MSSEETTEYAEELRRLAQIEGQLSVALTLMEPAWSGLANHPDMDGLDDKLNELRNVILEARRKAMFLRRAVVVSGDTDE